MPNNITAEIFSGEESLNPVTGLAGDQKSPALNVNAPMPNITAEEFNMLQPESPDNFDYIGGGQTKWNPSKYDFQLAVGADNEELRAQDQSFMGSLAKGTGRFVGTAVTKTLSGLGYVASAPVALATGDISNMTANGFSSIFEGLEENIKEDLLPIYGTHKFDDPNFWKSMWTHKFWFDEAVDGAAFMASAIVGSKGINALGKATKVYSNLAKAMNKATAAGKFGKLTGSLSKVNYGALAKEADLLTMTAYNSISEAAFEAKDTQEQVKQALADKVKLGLMTEEEARTKAADAALETFAFNSLALMPSNYITNSFIFKTPKKIGGLPVFNKAGEEAALNPLTKKQIAGIFAKDAATSMASEGLWEENIQTAIQNYEQAKYAPKYTGEWVGSIAERMIDNFTTKEGQKSIFLGALMGLVPGGIVGVRQARAERASEAKMNQAIGTMMEMSSTQAQDYYKRQPILNENGEFEGWSDAIMVDKNGKPEIDENRVAATFAKSMTEYTDMTAALEESVKGNITMFEWLRNKRLANVGFQFYNMADGVEHFESWVDFYAAKEAEDLQRAGMPVDEKGLEELKIKYKSEAKALYDLNSYVKGNFTDLFDFGKIPEAHNFKNALLYKIFDAGVDQRFWADKKVELEKELNDLNAKAPTVLEAPIVSKRKAEITKLLTEVDKVTADLETKTKDLLDESKQKEIFEQDMEVLDESKIATEAEKINAEKVQEAEESIIPPVESLLEQEEVEDEVGSEMNLTEGSPFVKPVDAKEDIVDTSVIKDKDTVSEDNITSMSPFEEKGYKETTKETDANRTFTKQEGNLVKAAVFTKDGNLKFEYSNYGIEVQDTNGIKNKLDLLYVNGDLSKVRIYDTESNSEIVLKDNLPTKSNGEKFTEADGYNQLVDAIKETYKLTEITSTIEDYIGEEGTIEPIDAEDKLTIQMDNLEQGTADALNGVAYVSYDSNSKEYVTKSKALELEAINANDKKSIKFEVKLDPSGIVENKFTGKLGTLDKESIATLNKAVNGQQLTNEEIDSLLSLKNIDKFDNLVDVVPLVLYNNKLTGEPVYLHTSSYDILSVPSKISSIENKKERAKAYAEYVRTEQYRMRKFRTGILRALLQGKSVNISTKFVSDGTHNSKKGAKNNLLEVLRSVGEANSPEEISIGIATSTGIITMGGNDLPVGFGNMGNVFTLTNATPNGTPKFLKLNPSKLSAEHAQLVLLALRQAYTKGKGGFKAVFEAPNVEGLTVGELLSMMVFYGEKNTKYNANNASNSAKEYLKNKQLYVGDKGRTLYYGQFNIPLHNTTETQLMDFIKWATENKNYTINKKMIGSKVGKNFKIGNIVHDETNGAGYNSFIINNNFITTDVSRVEGTKSLFKQPAVVLNLDDAGIPYTLTDEEKESLNLSKAVELNKVFVAKNKVETAPSAEASKIAPKQNTPTPVADSINTVNNNAAKYHYKGFTTANEFSKLPNGSIIFTEYNGSKLKIGTVSDGKFYMTPSPNTSPRIKEILTSIGSFNLGNQGKVKEFDTAYSEYKAFVKIAIPNTTVEENAKKELEHSNKTTSTSPTVTVTIEQDLPASVEEEIARANAENEDYLNAFIPPTKVVAKVPNKATESFTNNNTDGQKKNAKDILDDILPIFRSTTWAPTDYKPIDLVAETKWLRSKFKKDRFGRSIDVKHVDKLIEIGNNRRAFGQFTKDAITISKLAEEGTVYHEAFHRVSLAYLTPEQRNSIYSEARAKYNLNSYSNAQVEEYLAEEFRKYVLAKEANVKVGFPAKVAEFFKDLFDLIFNFFTGKTRLTEYDINRLFESIDKGKFMFSKVNKNNLKSLEGTTRYYEIEGTEFENIPDYETFKEVTNNLFKLLLEASDIIGRDAKTNSPIININSFEDIHKINLEHLWRVLEIKNNQLLNAAQSNPEVAPVLNKISNTFTEILDKKFIFSKALVNYMNRLNIKQTKTAEIEDEMGEDRRSFVDFDKASFQVSYKDNVSSKIKLLVSVLPASNERSELTGLTKLADFGTTWSTLLNAMLGVTSMQGMMDRLQKMAADNFTFQVLYNTLEKDVNAQISFHSAVRKAKYEFVNAIAERVGDSYKVAFTSAAVQTASKNVIKDWSNEAYFNSKLISREEGKTPSGNVEFYNALTDRYTKLSRSTVTNYSRNSSIHEFDKYIAETVAVLNHLSIPIDKDTILTILKDKKKDFDLGLLEFITKDIAYLFGDKSSIKNKLVNNSGLQNIFADEKVVKLISEAYAVAKELDFVDSVLGPSGNIYYTISSNTYMTDVVSAINENESHVTTRLNAEYNKHSVVLNALKSPLTREGFKISTLASFITPEDTTGNGYDKLTEMEDMLIRMEAVRNGKILTPTPADRSFYTFLEGIGSLEASIDNSGSVDAATVDTFYGYYLDEVNRINNVRKQVDDVIAGRKSDNELFENYHYIQVGNRYKAKSGEVVINGKLFGKVNLSGGMSYKGRGANFTDFIGFDLKAEEVEVKSKLNKILLDRSEDALKRAVEYSIIFNEGGVYFNNLVNEDYLSEVRDDLFPGEDISEVMDKLLRNAFLNLAVNTMYGAMETSKVFIGDPSAFKNADDEVKRLLGFTSTGDNLAVDIPSDFMPGDKSIHNDIYNVSYFNDVTFKSLYYDTLFDKHVKAYVEQGLVETEEEAIKLAEYRLKALTKVNQTDGQTVISPEMYRSISIRLSEWSEGKEKAYRVLVSESDLYLDEDIIQALNIVMQPLKMTYVETKYVDGNAIPVFDKMSLAPVFRSVYKGTPMIDLIDRMEAKGKYEGRQPIHQMKFHSATKSGLQTRSDFFTDSSQTNLAPFDWLPVYSQNYKYLRRQLNTSPHEHNSVLLGSQVQKINMLNINKEANYNLRTGESYTGSNLMYHLDTIRAELSDAGAKAYLDSIGADSEGNITDLETTQNKLKKEAVSSGMAEYVSDSFKVDSEGNKYLEYDAHPGNRTWIENRFFSINKKATVDLNIAGNAFIQMTNLGLKEIGVGKDLRAFDEEGYTEAAISVSMYKEIIPNYDNLTHDQRVAFIIGNDLNMMGYRIPTQGPNSVYQIKAVRFLPHETGNIVLLPGEGTAFAGFDFDIDKMYIVRPHFKNGKKIQYLDNSNSTIEERYIEYINSYAPKDLSLYFKKQSKESLKRTLNEVKSKYSLELANAKKSVLEYSTSQLESFDPGDILEIEMSGLSHSNVTENEKVYAEVYYKSNIIKKDLPFNIKTAFWDKETELKEANVYGVAKIAEYIKFIDKYLEENTVKSSDKADLNTLKVNYEILLFLKDESLLTALKQELDNNVNYYNDLGTLAGLPSFEQFSSMPIERQNTKQALENRMLDIYNSVSFSDYTLITKTTPLGFAGDMLKDLSKLVREKRGEAAEDKRPLANRNITFQLDAKAKYKFGGAGIGPMALGNVHHALAQVYDLKLNTNLGIGNTDETTGLTSLAGVLGQDKRYISDWYSALIDAHVDIAADPFIYYLNVNDSTRNVLSLLIRSGVGLNSFYFIAQPSLVEIAKDIEMKSNKLGVEFSGLVKSIKTKIAEYESVGVTLDPNFVDMAESSYTNIFDINTLDRGLDTVSVKDAQWHAIQVATLNKFLELLPLGDSLSAAMMASRVDTKKYGNNTIESLEYLRAVENIIKEGTIVNIDKLLEDSYLASMHKNSIELTVKTIGKMVLNSTPAFIDALQRVGIKQGAYSYGTAEKLDTISKELYTQIASEFFIKEALVTPKAVKSLMTGDNSVAKRISRIKNLEEHVELATNKLIQRLTPIYETGKPHFLVFRKTQDVGIKNDIYQDWKKLYLSENEEVKQLAIDLLYYNYISTGFNNTVFSFFDLVPAEILRDLGYNEFVRNKLKYYQDNNITDSELEDLLESSWSNTKLIPRLPFDSLRDVKRNEGVTYLFKTNKYSTSFTGIDKNGNHIYKEYVTVGSGDNIQLYKNIGTVESVSKGNKYIDGVYVIVPKKGGMYKNFHFRGNSMPSTIVKSNDINVVEGLKNLIYSRDYNSLINLTNAKNAPVFKEYINMVPRTESLVESTENKTSEAIKNNNSSSTFNVMELIEAADNGLDIISSDIELPEGSFEHNGNIVTVTKVFDYTYSINKSEKAVSGNVNYYEGNITPSADTVFVFGSNPEGRHGAGAAKIAREQFGAVYGKGEGLQGNSYALPTKDLRIKENNGFKSISSAQIVENIKTLYNTALQNPAKQFKIAYRNTTDKSLNGYTGLEMIDMFIEAGNIPSNIVFSKEWVDTGKFNVSASTVEQSEIKSTSQTKDNTYHLSYTPVIPTQEQVENKQKECE